jgi:hypothetical protein
MNNYKFPVLSDPQSTLKEWSVTLSRFVQEIGQKIAAPAFWDVTPVFSTTNFSKIDPILPTYSILGGLCFFSVGFNVVTTASPAFNFNFNLPVSASESGIVVAYAFADPSFPSGSAANTVFAAAGGGESILIERIDKNLFTASSTRTVYVTGFYRIG